MVLFLLYAGPLVLSLELPSTIYNNFMLLHTSIYILIQPSNLLSKFYTYVDSLLKSFVQHSVKLYEKSYISYNIHSAIHFVDDVIKFGPLDGFSCILFENFVGKIKRMFRGSNKPLQQLAKRLSEFECVGFDCKMADLSLQTPYFKGLSVGIVGDKFKKMVFICSIFKFQQ